MQAHLDFQHYFRQDQRLPVLLRRVPSDRNFQVGHGRLRSATSRPLLPLQVLPTLYIRQPLQHTDRRKILQ